MSRRGYSWFVVLGLCWAKPGVAAEVLTFSKALGMAQKTTLGLKSSELNLRLLKLDQEILERSDWPTLSGSLGYRRILLKETEEEERKNLSAGLSLKYQLYDFGRQNAKEEQQKYAIEAQSLKINEINQQLVWDIGRAYAQVIVAVKSVTVTAKQLEVSQFKENETSRQFRQGVRPQLDVVAAQVERGKAEVSLQRARDKKTAAMRQLCLLMNVGFADQCLDENQYDLPPALAEVSSPAKVLDVASSWTYLPSTAEKTREAQRQQLVASRKEIDASLWPTISTGLTYETTTGTRDTMKNINQTFATLGLDWIIPWHGMNRLQNEKITEQTALIDIAAQIESATRKAQEQTAQTSLKTLLGQWDLLLKQKGLLETERRLVKRKYDNGNATILELNQSESDIITLEQDIVSLSGQSYATAVDLAQSRGVTDIDKLFEGQ